MIHLSTEQQPDVGLCGVSHGPGNFCTFETPHSNQDWSRVCLECKIEYDLKRAQDQFEFQRRRLEYERQQAARPFNERFHDKMERLASFGDRTSDIGYMIPYLGLMVCTLGLSAIFIGLAKSFAKWYLKATK